MTRFLAPAVALTLLTSFCLAAEPSPWPRFRGPNGSGIAAGAKPPAEIGPETNVKWKVAAPSGLSSPIIVGDLVVITAFEDGKLFTIAYRGADGKEVIVSVTLPSGEVFIKVWHIDVGRVKLFVLDTNIPQNSSIEHREITDQLYGGDIRHGGHGGTEPAHQLGIPVEAQGVGRISRIPRLQQQAWGVDGGLGRHAGSSR